MNVIGKVESHTCVQLIHWFISQGFHCLFTYRRYLWWLARLQDILCLILLCFTMFPCPESGESPTSRYKLKHIQYHFHSTPIQCIRAHLTAWTFTLEYPCNLHRVAGFFFSIGCQPTGYFYYRAPHVTWHEWHQTPALEGLLQGASQSVWTR